MFDEKNIYGTLLLPDSSVFNEELNELCSMKTKNRVLTENMTALWVTRTYFPNSEICEWKIDCEHSLNKGHVFE